MPTLDHGRSRARAVQLPSMMLVILTGAWFRFDGLADESVWHDEAHSALMARLDAFAIVRAAATADNNPPLYYLLLHSFTQLAGADSEAWLRAPSVVFGILGIFATFVVARELGGPAVGLWAATLLAVSVFHIQHSREARMYSLLYAAATLNMYLFLKLRTGNSTYAVSWMACTLATLFAHTVGVFVVLAQHISWAVLRVVAPRSVARCRTWLIVNTVVAFAAAPWAWVILQQQRRREGVFWVTSPYLSQPVDVLAQLAGSFTLLVLLVALGCAGVAAIIGRSQATAEMPSATVLPVLIIWGGVPLLVPWLMSYVSVPIFIPRIAIACLAPLLVAAAFGLAALRFPVALMIGTLVIATSTQLAWKHTHELTKEDWRGVAGYVAPRLQPADLVLFHEGSRRKGFDYYVPKPVCRIAGFPEHGFGAGQTVQPAELPELHRLIGGHQRVWLILASSNDPERLIERTLSARFAQSERRQYRRVTVIRFEAPFTGRGPAVRNQTG